MKILLPIDHSDCSISTLKWAVSTFDKDSTEFHLLTVVSVYPDINEIEYDIQDSKSLLNHAKEALLERGAKHITAEYMIGDAVENICQYAEDIDADLVVVGSHGKSALKKVVLGSVSSDVLERCKHSVILYRNIGAPKAIHLS